MTKSNKRMRINSGKKGINLAKFVGAPKGVKVESGVPPLPKSVPWLVCCSHGKHGRATTFYDMEQEAVQVRNIVEMHNKCCLLSSHGWLLMVDEDDNQESRDCFLFNPATCRKISLPRFPTGFGRGRESGGMVGTMSATPTNMNSNCVIIFAEQYRPNIALCHPNKDDKWTRLSFVNDFDEGGFFSLISHQGSIYGLSWQKLVVLQFEANSVRFIPQGIASLFHPCKQLRNTEMLVQPRHDDDEMILVHKSYMCTKSNSMFMVNVVRWDACQKDWVQVESLGLDRVIFMCDKFAMPMDVKGDSSVKGDCIYISKGGEDSPYLYRFDMALQAMTTIVPWPNLLSPWSSPLWVLPCDN